ncbi:Membrane proteins related to metalloendopeptidases [hydrothermal vent metagenome]|uniref:Membrane proteins related to metalloendopeptidases n=1 Tax=hydrothermal vent metagenome TaxID=652676 RepID=A0A1W1BIZ6_9ZZZZ
MRLISIFISLIISLQAAKVVETRWLEGQVFSKYLEDRKVPLSLMNSIDDSDKQFLSEIQIGMKFFELFDESGQLLQALIPIGEEMQIQIARDKSSGKYSFDIIPIEFSKDEYKVVTQIETNPHDDIIKATNNRILANKINSFLKEQVDCRKLKKSDTLAIIYAQKKRLGKPFGSTDLKIAMIETGGKKRFIYADEEGVPFTKTVKKITYDSKGNRVTAAQIRKIKASYIFGMPLRHIRISSRFTYKRWHPILHRYRPHLGVDFAARRGTPLLAVNKGKVIFAGWKGGYGKVVKIRHRSGYVSLYAHQSRIKVKRGQSVKKGQIIGYVGSTGRSTGPHLHFGLYKRGKVINPLKVLKKSSGKIASFITKRIEIKGAKEKRAKIMKMLKHPPINYKWEYFKLNYTLINEKKHYTKVKS